MDTEARSSGAAYVTLLTKASYLPGTLVLEQSLRSVGAKYPFAVMATSTLDTNARGILSRRGIEIVDVDALLPEPGVHKLAEHDARFADTWTKLRCAIRSLNAHYSSTSFAEHSVYPNTAY
jgi:hypothetical protein